MQLATIKTKYGIRAVIVNGKHVIDIRQADANLPAEMIDLISNWDDHQSAIRDIIDGDSPGLEIGNVEFAPPIANPQKIICIGLNYADHAAETGASIPNLPVVFNKFPTTLIGHGDPIKLPSLSSQVDYEAELVVVIGKTATNVSREEAMQHVFGYCCGHDVSARDWQKGRPGGQWLLGKTFDTFAPCGPTIVTADEVPNPGNLNISLRLNGKTMQDSNTQNFIFPIDHLISHLSQFSTLLPGDLIFTGTPPGVGMARDPQVFLKDGDEVEIEIQGLGTLRNPVEGS